MIALLAGLLFVLLAVPTTSHLRQGFPRTVLQRGTARARRPPTADLAELLDAIARQVRSGASLTAAVLAEVDSSPPFAGVADCLRAGSTLGAGLSEIVPRTPDQALTVQALSACAHLGGPISATLDEAAAVLRERGAARAERLAHGAQARLSARVLTVVPICFAGWNALASQRTRDVYLSSAAGGLSAMIGLALNLAGWRWMKRIIGAS
jgi:Flp pilus assembly protein TadB